MELGLFFPAFLGYTAATVLALAYAATRKEELTDWMWRILGGALALHLISLGFRLEMFWREPANRYFLPVNSFFGALSFLALAMAAVFWVVEGRHRLNILGAFVLPFAWIAAAGSLWRALIIGHTDLGVLHTDLQSGWLNLHPMLLMTAYAAFANAFGVALAMLLQEQQMKSRKPSELSYRLPSIAELDDLNFKIIAFFFPLLSIGLFMGSVWAHGTWGRFWGWDAKEVFAMLTWGLYVAYLYMRTVTGMRGRKTTYVSMAAFASVVFTFFAVNYMSAMHGYLSK